MLYVVCFEWKADRPSETDALFILATTILETVKPPI